MSIEVADYFGSRVVVWVMSPGAARELAERLGDMPSAHLLRGFADEAETDPPPRPCLQIHKFTKTTSQKTGR